MVLETFLCGPTLNDQISIYDCPDYRGYTLAPTKMQVLQCYFTVKCIYIV
jgi:hypothetical protein